jgi:beta-lactamase regulating signal transducer with metallopeptidase domain
VTDFLIIAAGFMLAFQFCALLLAAIIQLHNKAGAFFQGFRGLYLVLAPLAVAGAFCVLTASSHLMGNLDGEFHARSNFDAHQSSSPALWLSVIFVLLTARFIFQIITELRLVRHLRRFTDAEPEQKLLAELQQLISDIEQPSPALSRIKVRFHNSPAHYEPFIRGFLQPIIYLHSKVILSLTTEDLKAIVLHELGHRRRGDHLVSLFYTLFVSPMIFGRTLRQGYQQWVQYSEHKCDDYAAERLGSRRAVAVALISVVKLVSTKPAPLGSRSFCGYHSLKVRVLRLLDDSGAEAPKQFNQEAKILSTIGMLLYPGTLAASLITPNLGLNFYCFLESVIGMYCIG